MMRNSMAEILDEEYQKKTKEIHEYLNIWIGFYYNQTYYCGWFWTNVATPISLALTILTAINAAQERNFITDWWHSLMRWKNGAESELWLSWGVKKDTNNASTNTSQIELSMLTNQVITGCLLYTSPSPRD